MVELLIPGLAVAISVATLLIERLDSRRQRARDVEELAKAATKDTVAALESRLRIKDAEVAELTNSRDYWRDRARAAEREAQSAKDDLYRVLREGKGLDQ